MQSLFRKRPPAGEPPASEDAAPEEGGEGSDAEAEPPRPFANAVDFNPLPREPEENPESSDEIFAEIGRKLRERREMLSLTHDEIERHTRVRASFMKLMEAGRLDGLPSAVQTRGILANYAAFIDLDVDTILLRYADGIQARHRENKPHWPPRTRAAMTVNKDLPPLRAFIASDLLFGGGAAIMLILFALWGINRVVSVRAASPARATARPISAVLAEGPLPTLQSEITFIPPADTPLATPTLAVEEAQPTPLDPSITVQLKLTASERTFMRVLVDDLPLFEGRAEPGKVYYYQAVRQVEVLLGSGSGIKANLNGNDLGLMGGYGEVVDQIFTARGVLTPTATIVPTATASITPTGTPRATATLPTFTPTAGEPDDKK